MTDNPENAVTTIEDKSCAGCLNQLLDEQYICALGQEWHTECFRCSACDIALSSWYFEKDGLLFCRSDYLTRYGEACQQCSQIITGPVMAAGDHRFHPECFCCELCSTFIGDGEAYALIERSKLYCGACYERVMRPLSRGGRRHAIQLVEIPPRSPGTSPFHPSAPPLLCLTPDPHRGLTIKHVDVSCGLMALHIGDRILEINGTPVKDQPISQIENLICYSDTVLQLTIEHDPDDSNARTNQQITNGNKIISTANISIDTVDKVDKISENILSCDVPLIEEIPEKIEATIIESLNESNKICDDEKLNEDVAKNTLTISIPAVGRERVFRKRAEDGAITGGARARQLWRKAGLARTPHPSPLGDKERSSSMSQLVDGSMCKHTESCEDEGVFCDLARTRSFRVDARPPPTVFRATDLLQGELLGSGFFGQVFKVTHRDTNEVMVLKQLYRVDEDAQNNFLKEVAVLRSLSHPNVLRFVGVLYKEQRLHLVTEYVGGGTLRALLEGSRIPPWAERAGYARDIASGLAYLHRKNVIHRDLNSHNCLVREDKTVIVADFGLARIVKRTGVSGSLERSQRGSARERKKRYTVVGNPYWMAPEMMKGNVYDEKVDVFSFGIVLCEIIGRVHADPDFLPRSSDFGLNQALFIDKFCQGCPEPLYNIAFLCCNLNPDKRPPFEVMEVWLESLNLHLSTQQTPPMDLLMDIKQYTGPVDYISPTVEKFEPNFNLPTPISCPPENKRLKIDEPFTNTPANSVLTKSKSGDLLEAVIKICLIPENNKVRGLGPKCISASHLCLPNKPIIARDSLSKSQNALSSTPAGYILSTDDKTISITKVDDVREWLDRPIILRGGEITNESLGEKRQSADDLLTISQCNFQKKPRKIESMKPDTLQLNLKTPNVQLRVLKSQSAAVCNANLIIKDKEDTPCYLRNQSVHELESECKMMIDVQPISRHYSITNKCEADNASSDSDDAIDEPKSKMHSPFSLKNILKSESKSYVVNGTDETKTTPNGKRKIITPIVSTTVEELRRNFEPTPPELPIEKNKGFNGYAKKLLSPKFGKKSSTPRINPLTKIFHTNQTVDKNVKSKDCKTSPKCKSTFFVSKPNTSNETNNEYAKIDSKLKPPKPNVWSSDTESNKSSNIGKCMTPILRRHNRQNDEIIGSVGRFSYREKRLSPFNKNPPDIKLPITPKFSKREENDSIQSNGVESASTPLVRCNNFNNIPSLTTAVDETTLDHSKASDNNDLGISNSNYVSLANLRINCPSLGRTRESIVKRNISKFDTKVSINVKSKFNKMPNKCVQDVDSSSLIVDESSKPVENTPL